MYIYTKEIGAQQKSYGFKSFVKLEVENFFSKSQQVGRFLFFKTKLHVLPRFFLFLSKKRQFFVEGQHRKFQKSQMCDFGILDGKVGFIFILRSGFLK